MIVVKENRLNEPRGHYLTSHYHTFVSVEGTRDFGFVQTWVFSETFRVGPSNSKIDHLYQLSYKQ